MVALFVVSALVSSNTKIASAATWMPTSATIITKSSSSANVMWLQATLNAVQNAGLVVDGKYGAHTTAAIKIFQSAHPTTGSVDGIAGKKTIAALNVAGAALGTMTTGGLPAGCTSTSGFSTTTGAACNTGTVITPGLPAGCVTTSGFSPVTGASCATGTVTTTSGPFSVMLSSDNPAAGYVISNQATADLAHFAFTGSGTLNSVTLARTGISDQNTLSNVYLYNGNTRLTDGYSFNNTGVLTMNNLGIAINGSMVISVKADISSTAGTTASTVGVALTGYTAGTTAANVNIAGNMMYVGTGTPASVYLSTQASVAVPNAQVNAGTSAYTVWSAPVQVNTRAIFLKGANFRMVGSAPSGALANIKLYVDGVATGNSATVTSINGSSYAMFDFTAAPISLATGSHTIDVRADVVSGSSYTVQVSLQQAADLVLFDPQLGINIAASVSSTVPFASNNAGTITINGGTASVVIDPTFSAMTNVTGGATNIDIAKFKVHGYGENVKVSSLAVTPVFPTAATATATTSGTTPVIVVTSGGTGYMKTPTVTLTGGTCSVTGTVTPTVSSGIITGITASGFTCSVAPTGVTISAASATQNGLNNVAIYFNGSQVGSSQNWPSTGGALTFNLGSQMIIPAGVDSTIEVRADLQDASSVNYTNGTVAATLSAGSSNAQGQTSHTTVNFPTGTVAGTSLSIQTGLLAVSSNGSYTNQNVNPNTAGVKIGSYILQNQSTSEAINVTSLVVGVGGSTSLTNLSNLRTSETSGSGSTPVQPTATNTFSVNFTLAPGATKTIDILADTSTATSVNVITTLAINAIGANSHIAISVPAVTGQTITFAAGTITNSGTSPSLLTASATTSQFVAAANGAANATKATYNFAATGGSATITELKFSATGATTITSVSVGGVSAPIVGGVAYLTGLNLVVPNGSSGLNQDVLVSYPTVGTNGLGSNTTSVLTLTSVKYTSGGVTTTFLPNSGAGVAAPQMTLVGSKPTVGATKPVTVVAAPLTEAIDVTVAADAAGNIALNTLPITVSEANVVIPTTANSIVVKDANNTTVVTTNTALTATGGASTITFTGGYTVQAGQSQTFKIFVPITSTAPSGVNSVSLSTALTSGAGFSWTDIAGGGSTPITGTTLIPAYPNTFTSVLYN